MTRRSLTAALLCLALAGCAGVSTSTSTPGDAPGQPAASAPATTSAARTAHKHKPHHAPRPRHPHRPAPTTRAGGLAYSTASTDQVQPQPPAGSCHATGSGLYSEPDPRCTPGALNPAVTQATIHHTICVPGYTTTIRPAESITESEKRGSMDAYGDTGSMSDYEYDHLVSLELGGAANDPRNLWPEPGASPNPKDSVENALHEMVCSGQMTLGQAQHIIATGWASYAKRHSAPTGPTSAPHSTPSPAPAPAPSTSAGPSKPISEVNCSDFATHAAAQQWFTAHGGSASNDVAGLDGDHDGSACEDLP